MKRFFFTAILLLIFFIDNQANDSVLIFYKDDCPYCREMKESLDNDIEFKEFLNQNYVVTLIDINSKDGSAIAELYNVRAVPTILKYDESSGKTNVLKGFGSIKRFSAFLNSEVASTVTTLDKSRLLTCGNGTLERTEQCDDGNANANDGCNSSCKVEEGWTCSGRPSICSKVSVCGNEEVEAGEQCDDGNIYDNDGCSNSCEVEVGWSCEGNPSHCNYVSYCGNGVREGDEQCDDGNLVDTDNCNNSCESIELSFCGNGLMEGEEWCDDGNANDNDGCSSSCEVEVWWTCTGGSPSVCNKASVCGNGIIDDNEQCDDGNIYDNDGCSNSCEVEEGWSCEGNPSLCSIVSEPLCGNGEREGDEQCDDGNMVETDGCNNSCETIEQPVCGNGEREGDEQCDDGNLIETDGCNNSCKTIVQPVCGNKEIEGDEQCDDGNIYDNDGCSKSCEVEEGWSCKGNPSLCESIVNVKISETINNSYLTRPVYPNPFTKNINISLFLAEAYDIEIFIIEITGRITDQFIINGLQVGNNNIDLDLSDLLPGNYIMSMKSKNSSNLFNKAVRIRKD